jgi:hypothetical protein
MRAIRADCLDPVFLVIAPGLIPRKSETISPETAAKR